MSFDYFSYLSDNLKKRNESLFELEDKLRITKDDEEKKKIRKQKGEEVEKLKKELLKEFESEAIWNLMIRLADDIAVWWHGNYPFKEDVRKEIYISVIKGKSLVLKDLDSFFKPDFSRLPSSNWIGLQVDFELLTPWYSKDDRVFYPLDNPVRKDRIFNVPFMSATSWKGLLRWACRMQAGLRRHFENGKRYEEWEDPDWILHFFGNEKGEEEDFHQGALVFYPTWFDRIDFEVINPHSREKRAGRQPIFYEVVPSGAKGSLYLLYAPWPGMMKPAKPEEVFPKLLEAIEVLLTTYGISAKRTVGWGTAKIESWKAFGKRKNLIEEKRRETFWERLSKWFQGEGKR